MFRSFRKISFYVAREFIFSFFVAFLFFFFIFFVNQLLVMAEEIFSKKVPIWDVVLLVVYSLPAIVALSFPFGALVGSLMTVGALSSNNEVLAFQASGIPLRRLFAPLVVLGMVFSVISFITNDYFLPLGNIRLGRLYRKIIYTNPGIELKPYSVKKYEDTLIVTGDIEGNTMQNIVIIDKTAEGNTRIITAKEAYLEESEVQRGVISMQLNDVFMQVSDSRQTDRFEYSSSKNLIYNLLLKNITLSLINPGPGEMSSVDVWKKIQEKEGSFQKKLQLHVASVQQKMYELVLYMRSARNRLAQRPNTQFTREQETGIERLYGELRALQEKKIVDKGLQNYQLEFYKKFSVPFSCFIFAVFAVPAGMFAKRSGRSVGFGVGTFVSIFYWGLLFAGLNLGRRLDFSPFFAMWIPNFLVLFLGIVLLLTRVKR